MKSLGFQQFKQIHMIGIGGSGMIGLATILQKRGFKITGSDFFNSSTSGVINKSQPSLFALRYNFSNFLKFFSKSPKSV